ncbi:hypothetical protein TIFTF001_008483 [Ficus carica]|uniref:Uncharacterized protein n=1 Tax=Ficus carica TaxID=3494 RepID=A0AA87ZSK6_FICCA|nr:hypothetical protein TIFTF001_008483 [Ficus carica]
MLVMMAEIDDPDVATSEADDQQQRTNKDGDWTAEKGSQKGDQLGDPDVNNHHAIPRQFFDGWGNSQHGQPQTPVNNNRVPAL